MHFEKHAITAFIGVVAVLFVVLHVRPAPERAADAGPTMATVQAIGGVAPVVATAGGDVELADRVSTALAAFSGEVRRLSHERALPDAFGSYFAYRSANPRDVRKPYLFFVDYGLPSTQPRGYVFDMKALKVVEGPFTVAHGRGSSSAPHGVPTRFSNVPGSKATSLGLYLAQETYRFSGRAGGRPYGSVGLRLKGVSKGFNDNARARRIVAHGAPYVTPRAAGRSEGCPAMDQARARRLLPRLANGGMVFHFAPDPKWMAGDPWLAASAELALGDPGT